MKLQTNSRKIAQTNCTCWWFFSIGMKQFPIRVMKGNDSPAAPSSVVDIELVPSVCNLVSLGRQLSSTVFCRTPLREDCGLSKPIRNQVVAYRQLRAKVFNRVIADSQGCSIWDSNTFKGDSEQLPFHIAPLCYGATKLMFEGNGFFGGIHDVATKTPNVELTGAARFYRAASSDRRERG